MPKQKEVSNLHFEPTTSETANLKQFLSSPFPLVIPPPGNPSMASMQYSLPSLEGRSSQKSSIQTLIVASLSGTLGLVEAVRRHSFSTLTGFSSQNKCLQYHHSRLKLALLIAVLSGVMVTVPAVYTSVINQKTDIQNINTSALSKMTEIPNKTQMIEVPTANNHLTFNGL